MPYDLFEMIRNLRNALIGLCSDDCKVRIKWALKLISQQIPPAVKYYLMFKNSSKAPQLEFISR